MFSGSITAGRGGGHRTSSLPYQAARAHLGAVRHPSTTPEYDRVVARVRAHLGDVGLHDAGATGRAMTLEQATGYALELDTTN